MEAKTKKVIILLAAIFLLCGVSLGGAYAWKTWKANQTVENPEKDKTPADTKVPGKIVLDADGMPEDGSDITETKKAADIKTLRELLLEDGKFAIELTENVRIDETLKVNGTKKLVGSKSITMELYAKGFQSVLLVPGGSTLIMDGVTLDGNGIANGVTVEKKAGFTGLSGKILYPVPYGVIVAGTARMKNITIDHSMDIGLCAQEGGKISLEGGRIVDSTQTGIHIQSTAQVNISNNAVVEGGQYCVRNRGTCVVTGGTLRDASGCLVYSVGDLTIDYKGKNADDRLEWYGALGEAGIRIGGSSTASIQGLYLHDMKKEGIRAVNHNSVSVTNCVIANTGGYGFDSVNGKEEAVVSDLQILDTKASAFRTRGTVKVSITNLTIKNTTGFGIKNENNLVVAKNVTIENCEKSGIWGSKGSTTQVDGATVIKAKEFGVNNDSAKMNLKNVKIIDPGRMGVVSKKESVTELANVTISNPPERGIYNLGGTMTASDITVASPGQYGVSTAKSSGIAGQVTVTGLTVTGVKEKDALNCYDSVLYVTKGKVSEVAQYGARVSKGGKLSLTDVEIQNCKQRGIGSVGGDVTLQNVSVINPGEFGVTASKTSEFTGQMTAKSLTISGVKSNALNCSGSVMSVTAGNIYNIDGNGAYVEKGGQLSLTDVKMRDCMKRGIYLRNEQTKAIVIDTRISDTGSSSIFLEAGTTVEANHVTANTSKSYGVFVKSGTLKGQDLSITGTTQNGLHVASSTEEGKAVVDIDGLTVKNAKERGVQNIGGDVTLKNVNIISPKTFGATTSNTGNYTGKLDITNLTLTDVESNALNCNGSVLKVTKGTISDIEGNGAYVEKGGQLTLSDVEMKNCEKRGVYVKDDGTKATVTDTNISNTGSSSIFLEPGAAADVKQVTLDTSKSYGAFVKGGNLKAKDLTIINTVENALHIASSEEDGKAVASVEGLNVENTSARGVQNIGGNVTLKNVSIVNPGTYAATTSKTGDYTGKLDITNLTVTGVQKNSALNCNESFLQVTKGTISGVKQNGAYVEKGGQLILKEVEIADCERRGIYVNASTTALENVKLSNTNMTNLYITGVAVLNGQNVVVEMNDLAERTDEEKADFYGIYVNGSKANVTIDGELSSITRNIGDGETPENSAVWLEQGALTINGGAYSGLKAKNGSLIYNKRGNVTINGGVFKDNVASNRGGVIYTDKTTTTINGGEFAGNRAEGTIGGGVLGGIGGSTLIVTNGYFHNNTAASEEEKAYGGGVIESGGKITISGGTFEANTAFKGGAVYVDKAGTLAISGGEFFSNETFDMKDAGGGVIYNRGDNLTITGGTFGNEEKGNIARHRGGVLYINSDSCKKALIKDAAFIGNSAKAGRGVSAGVLYVDGVADVTIENCKFEKNKAEFTGTSNTNTYGGVMYINGGTVTVTGTSFIGNEASLGGAVYKSGAASSLTLKECSFEGNVGSTSVNDVYNNEGMISLAGKVTAGIGLNKTAGITVNEALTEGSAVTVRVINTSSIGNAGRTVVTFKDDTVMGDSQKYILLDSKNMDSYKLSFAESKATVTKK